MPQRNRAQIKQATLAIDFLIIGAGLSGLSCAAALRRVGHRVLVLEKGSSLGQGLERSQGCRMPPNLSKILYHWGLKEEVDAISTKADGIDLLLYESGECLGTHKWDSEMLKESRGDFVFAHYHDLQKLLYNQVIKLGGEVRFDCQVTSVDPERGRVILATGEALTADVIVGADGVAGMCRQMYEEEQEPEHWKDMYSAMIPKAAILGDDSLNYIYSHDYVSMFSWFGDEHAALGFPLGGNENFCLFVYSPVSGQEKTWEDDATRKGFDKLLSLGNPILQKLAELAKDPVCVPVKNYSKTEDWVHDDGPLVLIGEAAHPLPPGSIQQCAMAIEDGAVLAKLFSHLRTKDQITSFLYAFQDLRQPHVDAVCAKEIGDIGFMTLPPDHMIAQGRNQMFREKRDRGVDVMATTSGEDEMREWAEIKGIFGYDAEDEADNWWVEWGLLRERANGVQVPCNFLPSLYIERQVAASSI